MKYKATFILEDKTIFLDILDSIMGYLNEGVKGSLKLDKNANELLNTFSNTLDEEEIEKALKQSGDELIRRAELLKKFREEKA